MRGLRPLLIVLMSTILAFTLPGLGQRTTAAAATARTPIVFVHGLTGSDSNFALIERYLRGEGWASEELFAIDLPSKAGISN